MTKIAKIAASIYKPVIKTIEKNDVETKTLKILSLHKKE